MTATCEKTDPVAPLGITLLEVLISIGVLAVGLGSVAALMPAARSQASRALILDRGAVLAANAVADAATLGLLREGAAMLIPAATSGSPVVVDPVATAAYLSSTQLGQVSGDGVAAPPAAVAPPGVLSLVTQLRDDVTLSEPPAPDDLPSNAVVDGARGYVGRTTCLLCVRPALPPAEFGTLSAVIFHGREAARPLAVSGTLANLRIDVTSLDANQLDGRRMRDVVKPGAVLWEPAAGRFHQVAAAAFNAAGSSAFLTLQSGTALAVGTFPVQFLTDSVGLAERRYRPESAGEYTR